jgi:hypothetical protein
MLSGLYGQGPAANESAILWKEDTCQTAQRVQRRVGFQRLHYYWEFATSSLSEWLRDGRAGKRERAIAEATSAREHDAREAIRRIQLFERRASFQRETLLNLQDAVVKLSRAAGRIHHLDVMEQRKNGTWGGNLLPEDLNDEAHHANVALMVLTARIRDDHIREMVQTFRNYAGRVGISRTEQAEKEALARMVEVLEPLHQRIGEILRKLDDDEDASALISPSDGHSVR